LIRDDGTADCIDRGTNESARKRKSIIYRQERSTAGCVHLTATGTSDFRVCAVVWPLTGQGASHPSRFRSWKVGLSRQHLCSALPPCLSRDKKDPPWKRKSLRDCETWLHDFMVFRGSLCKQASYIRYILFRRTFSFFYSICWCVPLDPSRCRARNSNISERAFPVTVFISRFAVMSDHSRRIDRFLLSRNVVWHYKKLEEVDSELIVSLITFCFIRSIILKDIHTDIT
jgi:hypothetical protein